MIAQSEVLRSHLAGRGCQPGKTAVIRNGADPDGDEVLPSGAPARYVVYVGALQSWQGLDTLLRALARLADLPDLELVIVSASHRRHAKPYYHLAERLDVAGRVRWFFGLDKPAVAGWLSGAMASVAPLTDSPRNTVQGCCPIKIIESMAAGTPVVASDLPAVRELITDRVHGRLVPAGRPADLARVIRVLFEYPDEARAMGEAGRAHVRSALTWAHAQESLTAGYQRLLAEGQLAG